MDLIINIILLFFTLSFIIFGVIGYGIIFSKVFYFDKKIYFSSSYYVIFGLVFLVFISYYTNLIVAHSEIFNFLLFLIGFSYYIFCNFNKKLVLTKNIFLLIIIYFSFILISKNHDDFFYYHLSSTLNLVENKLQFGLGNLKLGYRHHSSILYLMSLTYFPIINFYLVNSINFIVFIFTSLILYENIKKYLNKNNLITFFSLLFFILINLKFKRLSEYGTDLAAQLLIIVLFLNLIKYFIKKNNEENLFIIFSILILILSIKISYILYGFFIFLILFISDRNHIMKFILKNNKLIIFSILFIIVFLFQNFANNGCLLYPISQSCFFQDLEWTLKENELNEMKIFLELWAKSGANPHFTIENQAEYIKNFFWLKNWFNNYFLFKISDYVILNFSIILLIILFFGKNIYFDKNFKNKKYLLNFFLIIIPIALIWFFKHPSLRYGGYIIFSLFIFFSFLLFFGFKSANKETLKKKLGILIILSIAYFNISNIQRINKEINSKYIFKYSNFPFFSLDTNLLYKDRLNILNYKKKIINNYIFYLNDKNN
tara:strand:- start:1352 stop:2983 length:1632 start_codon:yes stop_codon:yes gene_type:complete